MCCRLHVTEIIPTPTANPAAKSESHFVLQMRILQRDRAHDTFKEVILLISHYPSAAVMFGWHVLPHCDRHQGSWESEPQFRACRTPPYVGIGPAAGPQRQQGEPAHGLQAETAGIGALTLDPLGSSGMLSFCPSCAGFKPTELRRVKEKGEVSLWSAAVLCPPRERTQGGSVPVLQGRLWLREAGRGA